jgi:hypothetical protein
MSWRNHHGWRQWEILDEILPSELIFHPGPPKLGPAAVLHSAAPPVPSYTGQHLETVSGHMGDRLCSSVNILLFVTASAFQCRDSFYNLHVLYCDTQLKPDTAPALLVLPFLMHKIVPKGPTGTPVVD